MIKTATSFIQTIPRRGYKFVPPVKEIIPARTAESSLPPDYWKSHSPFRGLQIFEPDDAWLFFGRNAETEELLRRLSRSPVLVVSGNSGCGKSSLVRAGLVSALRNGRLSPCGRLAGEWRVAIVRPSASPFDYLAEVLPSQLAPDLNLTERAEFIAEWRYRLRLNGEALRDAIGALANAKADESRNARILLVVDQFEELFALTGNQQIRELYIEALLAASRWDASVPVHLVLVLRADFYSHCLEHAGLSRCLETNLYNVPRMVRDHMRETIEKRLDLAGASAEAGLINSLLDEVGTEPGDLALLEHALSQLWERCGGVGPLLTSQAYSTIGRLRGALSAHATRVYSEITSESRKRLAQRIFLELVQIGEGAPDTRRRVRKRDLLSLGAPDEIESLLTHLATNRLVSISGEGEETFVEVSHEALIREWFDLRDWITHSRDDLRVGRRLVQAAQEWEDVNRDAGSLLQGARLMQAEEWLLSHPDAPSLSREFLQASVTARNEARVRALRKQRAAVNPFRWLSCILAALLLAATGPSWLLAGMVKLASAASHWPPWLTPYFFMIPGLAVSLWLLLIMQRAGSGKHLPWFARYVLWVCLEGLMQVVLWPINFRWYLTAYWWMEMVDIVLAALAIRESFLRTFSEFTQMRWFRWILYGVFVLIVAYSGWKAVYRPPVVGNWLTALVVGTEFLYGWGILAIALLTALLSAFLRRPVAPHEDAVVTGFGIMAAATLTSIVWFSLFGRRSVWFSAYAPPVGVFMAVFLWIWVFSRPPETSVFYKREDRKSTRLNSSHRL